jgi:cell division protein FtsL
MIIELSTESIMRGLATTLSVAASIAMAGKSLDTFQNVDNLEKQIDIHRLEIGRLKHQMGLLREKLSEGSKDSATGNDLE